MVKLAKLVDDQQKECLTEEKAFEKIQAEPTSERQPHTVLFSHSVIRDPAGGHVRAVPEHSGATQPEPAAEPAAAATAS